MYSVYTLCTMHLTRCTSLDVLHADLLHSVYYALHSVYYALDTLHFNRCINAVYLILCVLDPMYFSEGLCTEEPIAMLSGKLKGIIMQLRTELEDPVAVIRVHSDNGGEFAAGKVVEALHSDAIWKNVYGGL